MVTMHYIGGVSIEGDSDSWDFGQGAGFYLDATEPKWKKNYRMYSYVSKELPALVHNQLPIVRSPSRSMNPSLLIPSLGWVTYLYYGSLDGKLKRTR